MFRNQIMFRIVWAIIIVMIVISLSLLPFTGRELEEKRDWITASELLFEEGVHLYKTGLYHSALTKLDSSILIQPFYSPAYYYQGLIYTESGNPDSALTSFKRALTLDPESYLVRIEMAKLLLDKKDKREAKRLLIEANRINPYRGEASKLLNNLKLNELKLKESK
ncbi:tetratricopeptide repeat protein [candidate division WOR-3 bacterium]|nr:tetratricopeptide repeat protein [candidate division WOR-3 bacterium]